FDTKTLSDGLDDFRAVVTNGSGNTSTSVRTGVRVDNTAPQVVSSTPTDGTRVDASGSIELVASEAVTPSAVTLDGAGTVVPVISGARVTYNTGPLTVGLHTLVGTLTDTAGKSAPFRI